MFSGQKPLTAKQCREKLGSEFPVPGGILGWATTGLNERVRTSPAWPFLYSMTAASVPALPRFPFSGLSLLICKIGVILKEPVRTR